MSAVSGAALFGASGFRGVVPESFEPVALARLGIAFGALVREEGGSDVVLGRDTRPSGDMASRVLTGALMACGLDVLDVGIAPTPTVLHAAAAYDAGGSLTITASHNPAEWNGVEFALARGRLLLPPELDRLQRLFEVGHRPAAGWDGQGRAQARTDAVDLHLSRILDLPEVDLRSTKARACRVVIDAGNGAGSLVSPELLVRLGCDVIRLNCEASETFPRAPEPSPENLTALRDMVVAQRADVGFAHDADADRLVVVDETGRALPEEYTLALAADVLLERHPGPVVTTVVTGALIDEVARRHGAAVHRTRVGVAHVVERMKAVAAAVGGESTGGVIVPSIHPTTDGIGAIALIVSGVAAKSCTVSQWAAKWPVYHLLRASVPLPVGSHGGVVLDALAARHSEGCVDRTDGVKLSWDDAWLVARPSSTEPVLRIFAESADRARAFALLHQTVAFVASYQAQPLTR